MNAVKNQLIQIETNTNELRREKLKVAKKLQNLNPRQNDIEKIKNQKSSNLISKLKSLIEKSKNLYTGRDKVVFKKLGDIKNNHSTFKAKLNDIQGNKDILFECFGEIIR